jgi:hypothetical protein
MMMSAVQANIYELIYDRCDDGGIGVVSAIRVNTEHVHVAMDGRLFLKGMEGIELKLPKFLVLSGAPDEVTS